MPPKTRNQVKYVDDRKRGGLLAIRPTGLSSKDFATKLLEAEDVAAVPGDAFGSAGEGFLRCCYATSFDELKIAMNRMERFVGSL